jgi:hypothetical protein
MLGAGELRQRRHHSVGTKMFAPTIHRGLKRNEGVHGG